MRFSEYFLHTLREDPSEAEVTSHRLMLRAGMIRKVAAGVYSVLPFGLRAIRKFEEIVREEMDRAGAQEVSLPALQPAELWQASGRWSCYGPELMRLTDRHDRPFCLGPTHEEVITSLVAGEIRSYRQLPRNLYQIQSKFRDEIRPRFGVMRGREFIMKDAYSFDRDEAGAEESYRRMFEAYTAIFRRCGLSFKAVEADSGAIGGSFSHEFMVLADTGEDAVMSCDRCGYAANMEKAEVRQVAPAPAAPGAPAPRRLATPGKKSIEEVAAFLAISEAELVKTLVYLVDGQPVAVLVRGDHQLNEIKLKNGLRAAELRPATPEEVAAVAGCPVGFIGPVNLTGCRIVADQAVMAMAAAVTGGNEEDVHLADVVPDRDFPLALVTDLRQARPGDPCARCAEGSLVETRGIEVGHVFKLGTKYSAALGAAYLDQSGQERAMIMGCYGIGIGRTVAAAIEQNHDQKGIIWPMALAPFHVDICALKYDDQAVRQTADTLFDALSSRGWDCLLDDRDERPGVKFADAELLGIPLRITVGGRSLKEGVVEVRTRQDGTDRLIPLEEAADGIHRLLRALAGEESR